MTKGFSCRRTYHVQFEVADRHSARMARDSFSLHLRLGCESQRKVFIPSSAVDLQVWIRNVLWGWEPSGNAFQPGSNWGTHMHLRDSVTENNIKEYNIIVNYFAADFYCLCIREQYFD